MEIGSVRPPGTTTSWFFHSVTRVLANFAFAGERVVNEARQSGGDGGARQPARRASGAIVTDVPPMVIVSA